ncbi:MAG: hemolysin III family protein [Methylacidiphilales bacterium]|nr:hemolysin III family protein [Candidatus Methylacidiphilales bacterium]
MNHPTSMGRTAATPRPGQTIGEEIANSVSHGIGFFAAAAAAPFLILASARHGSVLSVAGASIFSISVLLLYFVSMFYHALPKSVWKSAFQLLDHAAIFLLIAGSYTPFTFGVLRGAWGWTLFGIVWGLAIFGMIAKLAGGLRHGILSNSLYLAMGWLIVIAIRPLWLHLPAPGLILLVAGGLAYTGGVVFYAAERLRYSHFIWHLFVMAGTGCHFTAIYLYCC